jgi:hypothetical protein
MAETPPYSERGDDSGVRPSPQPTGMPHWVKVFIIVAIVLVLAFIVSRLLGVQHGPRLHSPSSGSGRQIAPIGQEVEQP